LFLTTTRVKRRSLAAIAAMMLLPATFGNACGGSSGGREGRQSGTAQPEGEYSYATSGFEQLRAAVASRHAYPRTSTVTVSPEGCGFAERWEPRPERSAEWRFCVEGARWRLAVLLDYHEFFGQPVLQRFVCCGPFVPRPPTVPVGYRWTDRCQGAGSRVTVRYRAVREQTQDVEGRPVKTVLVRARADLRGRIEGVNRLDSWLSRENGLLVRRRVRSDTSIDSPFGKVEDRERYRLALRSLAAG
jgi:hypothetical protein